MGLGAELRLAATDRSEHRVDGSRIRSEDLAHLDDGLTFDAMTEEGLMVVLIGLEALTEAREAFEGTLGTMHDVRLKSRPEVP